MSRRDLSEPILLAGTTSTALLLRSKPLEDTG